MSEERARLAETWRSFFRERCADDLRELAEEYPRERSLDVDILDLYGFDEAFTQQLFDHPDRVLHVGQQALRELHDPFDRVNVRLVNHPGLLGLNALRTRHVSELVSVEAVVAEVGRIQAAVTVAAFACAKCGAVVRRRPGSRLEAPRHCDECGGVATMGLDRSRSAFVDIQRLGLERPSDEADDRVERRLDAVIDDDLVGTVAAGDKLLLTGILRLDSQSPANQFDFYLDAIAVSQEPVGARPPMEDVSSELREAIESRWELLGNR